MDKNIIEMFKSLQGEGRFIGILSIFIRFAKCNLVPPCDFCDTKFSLNGEGKYSIDNAIEYIQENNKYSHVIISGGEPMLYREELIEIISHFPDKYFTIETNSSILPNAMLAKIMFNRGLWSVSPKLHCWNHPFFIRNIVGWNSYINSQFKFVVNNLVEDMEKIKFLINTQTIDKQIIIQPDGNRKDYNIACRELADWVNENEMTQVRVLPQFHRLCWGQKRGI